MRFIFWTSALGLFYVYLGYPLILWALVQLKKRIGSVPSGAKTSGQSPRCSVVISSYNDAALLKAKIDSVLATQPSDCVQEILIASDGSNAQDEAARSKIETFLKSLRQGTEVLEELEWDRSEDSEMAQEASVVRLVNEILIEALHRRATCVAFAGSA